MRALLQRVSQAQVAIEGKIEGQIQQGYVILLGVGQNDTAAEAEKLWNKIVKLRLFADADGKTNLNLEQVGGQVLIVSQFTLYANCKKGNRPSFTNAGSPALGEELYEYFLGLAKDSGFAVASGKFGADMQVTLTNDGPFTIWLDTDEL